jgi:hypothetical protein
MLEPSFLVNDIVKAYHLSLEKAARILVGFKEVLLR